jgi:hypothetical protein
MVESNPKDDRGWTIGISSPKDIRDELVLPPDRSGYREERDWSMISHHLNTFVKSIAMNVGGPYVESAVLDEA